MQTPKKENTNKKSGYVGIVGKPNVGKSTLLNTLAKQKVAIISYKPQTTRNQINYHFKNNDFDVVFVDTPGFHFTNNKLDLFLNSQIKQSFKITDLVLLLIDPTRPVDKEDLEIIKILNSYKIENIVLVISKTDVVTQGSINNHINQVKEHLSPLETICISSKNNDLNELFSCLSKYLKNNSIHVPTAQNDNFIISEIIREQIFLNCKQELPYASSVNVEKTNFDKQKNIFNIDANILVEKKSQKPIVVGKNGSMIKKIGIAARLELLKIYECKINLKLFVKVETDWRNNEKILKDLGYSNK